MFIFLIFVTLLGALILYRVKRWNIIKYGNMIPGDKPLPIVGNINKLMHVKNMSDVFYTLLEISNRFEEHGIARVWIGETLAILVWDPSYVEESVNLPQLAGKGKFYEYAVGHSLKGVVTTAGGQKWRDLRKPLTKTMVKKYVENDYFPVFVEKCNIFENYIKKNKLDKEYDILSDTSALFLDMFSKTHLGVETNEVLDRKWNHSATFDELFSLSVQGLFSYSFVYWQYVIKLTSDSQKFEFYKKKLMDFMGWILNERRKLNGAVKDELYPDFLLRRGIEKKISDDELCRELADLVTAGSDTSSVIASSAVLFLAMFPEVQEKAYREQVAIFGSSDRDPTVEDVANMKYLEMVFKETIRKIGPPGVLKHCHQNMRIGKYTIPEGALVFPYIHKIHLDPAHWDDPSGFCPDHFLPEKEAARHKYAFLPFGCGPRICAGIQYGTLSTKVFLSSLLRKFKISTNMNYKDIEYEFKTFIHVRQGYSVKFSER